MNAFTGSRRRLQNAKAFLDAYINGRTLIVMQRSSELDGTFERSRRRALTGDADILMPFGLEDIQHAVFTAARDRDELLVLNDLDLGRLLRTKV
jgi:hypothetical protein